jgi:hypothetical protein
MGDFREPTHVQIGSDLNKGSRKNAIPSSTLFCGKSRKLQHFATYLAKLGT